MLDAGCLIACEVIDGEDNDVTLRALCVRSTRVREVPMSCRRRHGEMIFLSFGAANLNCQKHASIAQCTMHSSALLTHPQVNVKGGYRAVSMTKKKEVIT